jgi:hypothetical protein
MWDQIFKRQDSHGVRLQIEIIEEYYTVCARQSSVDRNPHLFRQVFSSHGRPSGGFVDRCAARICERKKAARV